MKRMMMTTNDSRFDSGFMWFFHCLFRCAGFEWTVGAV